MGMVSEEVRAKAEVYYGDELGQVQTKVLLQEAGLPRGLLPLRDIVECGYVEETGFVWVRQKHKVEHRFADVGRQVSYAAEITAYVEKSRIRKLTGVKVKELMLWLTLTDLSLDAGAGNKLTCKTSTGLFRVFPASAFELPGNPPPFPRHPAAAQVVQKLLPPAPEQQQVPLDDDPQEMIKMTKLAAGSAGLIN